MSSLTSGLLPAVFSTAASFGFLPKMVPSSLISHCLLRHTQLSLSHFPEMLPFTFLVYALLLHRHRTSLNSFHFTSNPTDPSRAASTSKHSVMLPPHCLARALAYSEYSLLWMSHMLCHHLIQHFTGTGTCWCLPAGLSLQLTYWTFEIGTRLLFFQTKPYVLSTKKNTLNSQCLHRRWAPHEALSDGAWQELCFS